MQRFALKSVAVLGLMTLYACDPSTSEPQRGSDELARQIEARGFRGDMVWDAGDYVVVEGDIRLEKSWLQGSETLATVKSALTSSLQYRTNELVSQSKVHQIRVDLSDLNTQSAWQNAARAAMVQWNTTSTSYVRFQEGLPADIRILRGCLGSNVAALASWPSGGNPGPTITVNSGCIGFTLNDQQRLHNMVHEFGHTLGFRHTNWSSQGESAGPEGAVNIAPTPRGADNNSVMNGGTALNQWAGFSFYDKQAVWWLYPPPAPSPTITYVSNEPRIEWAPVLDATSYNIYLRYGANGYDEYGSFYALGTAGSAANVSSPFTNTGNTYTGTSVCHWDQESGYWLEHSYYYEIEALFPSGGRNSGYVTAEVAVCN